MRRIRLLIADDDREVRRWLRLVLEQWRDPEIVEARNGEELWQLLCGQSFDLVVSDVRMPVRSGLQAARLARDAGQHLPFIFITGFGDEEAGELTRELGGSVLLCKPIDELDLIREVQRLLDLHGEAGLEEHPNGGVPR